MFIKVIEVNTHKIFLDGNFETCAMVLINEFSTTRIITLHENSTILHFYHSKIPKWIIPGIFLYAKSEYGILTLYRCSQDKIIKTINWQCTFNVPLSVDLPRYKCTAYLTVLDHGDSSILVKENLSEFSYVFIGSIKSSEIISCDEGSIIYFKDKIDKIPECFEMITNEM